MLGDRVLAEGSEPVQAAARVLLDEEVAATPIVCRRIGGRMSGQRLVLWRGSRCRGESNCQPRDGQMAVVHLVEHRQGFPAAGKSDYKCPSIDKACRFGS
jgi:hypothetical protein